MYPPRSPLAPPPQPATFNFDDDSPEIPCKFCPRKFHKLQTFSCHLKALKVEQAISATRRHIQNSHKASPIHEYRPTKDPLDNIQIGMCNECLHTSPLGSRIKSTILQAYLIRFRQLVRWKRSGAQKASSTASNVRAADVRFDNCDNRASIASKMASTTSAAPAAGSS